jgi:hypothetical protein
MMKTADKLMIICVFICLAHLNIVSLSVEAQSAGVIVIKADGSVSGTNLIYRQGSVYRLTGDTYDSPITVLCSNIVLDGAGFTLQGAGGWGKAGVAGVETTAAIHLTCSNVTVQNFNISGWEAGVSGANDGNSIIDNNITRTENAVAIYADNYVVKGNYLTSSTYGIYIKGNSNWISQNQIIDNYGGAMIYPTLNTTITENDFINNGVELTIGTYADFSYQIYDNNFEINANTTIVLTNSDALGPADLGTMPAWDNGSVGNYWSDHAAKYPGASKVGNSTISNTPYMIRTDPTFIDRYPLMSPASTQDEVVAKAESSSGSPLSPRSAATKISLVAAAVIAVGLCVVVLAFRNKLFWLQKSSEPA